MGRHRDFWRLTEDALVYATKSLGLDLTPDRRARLLEAYLTLAAFPDVKPGLEALKERGLRMAILSNGAPKMLEAAVRSAGIVDLLDGILSVEQVKIFKPSPRVYHLASEHLQARPAKVGFVSSNYWDVAGAASAGLETFWKQSERASRRKSSASPRTTPCAPSPIFPRSWAGEERGGPRSCSVRGTPVPGIEFLADDLADGLPRGESVSAPADQRAMRRRRSSSPETQRKLGAGTSRRSGRRIGFMRKKLVGSYCRFSATSRA